MKTTNLTQNLIILGVILLGFFLWLILPKEGNLVFLTTGIVFVLTALAIRELIKKRRG